MRELLLCTLGRGRGSQYSERYNRAYGMGIQRHASTRSTIKQNATIVTVLNNDHSSECSHDV